MKMRVSKPAEYVLHPIFGIVIIPEHYYLIDVPIIKEDLDMNKEGKV